MSIVFSPEKYKIEDIINKPFIDPQEIRDILEQTKNPNLNQVQGIIEKSKSKKRLSLHDTAILLNAEQPEAIELIKSAAKDLKKQIYGNRIVLFAPLYIGNSCTNNCLYCGFRKDNKEILRQTLNDSEIVEQVKVLENDGHKRLILVYGEHPKYSAEYIAQTVELVYGVRTQNNGEIRRININAAPFDVEGFKTIKKAGIGTYQIFQETYDPELYSKYHLAGKKRDYDYRLTSMDRAMEAGIDDVGLGALFGLGDWKFEVMGLVRHTNHLEACFGIGPHTISFPRIQDASGLNKGLIKPVSDDEFLRLVAILRLAVPYTGMIMTARETPETRDAMLSYGVSQIDGGTNLEIGGYSAAKNQQDINKEQFKLNDDRSLDEIIRELISGGNMPSFCTACYRKGRTGQHFMEFSLPGFIKKYCTPNAILTLAEYLEDYADNDLKIKGKKIIAAEIDKIDAGAIKDTLIKKLREVEEGKRNLLF